HGKDIIELGKKLAAEKGQQYVQMDEKERFDIFRQYGLEYELAKLKKDLEDFRVKFDVWYSETSLYENGKILPALEQLKEKGFIYEKDGATWFQSTAFGDDKDRVLIKKDGSYTYLMPDIAYHLDKLARGY